MDGGSVRRKASNYTQDKTNRINTHTDIYASSSIETHDPHHFNGREQFMPSTARPLISADFNLLDRICSVMRLWSSNTTKKQNTDILYGKD
jgi:hypothetical protein